MAPAAAALIAWVSKLHAELAWISAYSGFPWLSVSEPAGKDEQAWPLLPSLATSTSSALLEPRYEGMKNESAGLALSPTTLDGTFDPFTDTVAPKMCELTVAPTVMAEGAVPGEVMLL